MLPAIVATCAKQSMPSERSKSNTVCWPTPDSTVHSREKQPRETLKKPARYKFVYDHGQPRVGTRETPDALQHVQRNPIPVETEKSLEKNSTDDLDPGSWTNRAASYELTRADERLFTCDCERRFLHWADLVQHQTHQCAKPGYACGGILPHGRVWGCGRYFASHYERAIHLCVQASSKPERFSPRLVPSHSIAMGSIPGQAAGRERETIDVDGAAANPASSTTADSTLDDGSMGRSRSIATGLSGNSDDLPLPSRTSAAIFKKAQLGLERLLLDLRSFGEGSPKDDLSLESDDDIGANRSSPESSGEDNGSEGPCDGDQHQPFPEGRQVGTQQTTSSTSRVTGAAGLQDHGEPSRKRQRIDSDNDEHSRGIVKSKQKKPTPNNREQTLICCFRSDAQNPCSGTDKSICEVIDRLASSHRVLICKTCYVLLGESDSGGGLHPDGVDCVEHCLSPRCAGSPSTTVVAQKHVFNPKSCGTKTGRPRPEDRESIYRYIFKLVHPAKEAPAKVFTTGKVPHLGVVPRQGSRRSTRDELESRVEGLARELQELHKRDAASARTIEKLSAATEHLRAKMARLQDIIYDALQPGRISSEDWHRSLRMRANREAPDAMDYASMDCAQSQQTLPTPLLSFSLTSTSCRPSTVPTPNYTGAATNQYARSRDVNPQASHDGRMLLLGPESFQSRPDDFQNYNASIHDNGSNNNAAKPQASHEGRMVLGPDSFPSSRPDDFQNNNASIHVDSGNNNNNAAKATMNADTLVSAIVSTDIQPDDADANLALGFFKDQAWGNTWESWGGYAAENSWN